MKAPAEDKDSKVPSKRELLEDYRDEKEKGKWKGYVNIYSFSREKFRKTAPDFIKFDDDIRISQSPDTDAFLIIQHKDLMWSCSPETLCDFIEFKEKQKEFVAIYSAIEIWLTNTMIKEIKTCSILEEKGDHLLVCPINPSQGASMRKALSKSIELAMYRRDLEKFEPLPEGATIVGSYSKGEGITVGNLKVEKKGLINEDGQPFIKYRDLEPINGDNCEVLARNFDPPAPLIKPTVDINCCLRVRVAKVDYTLCVEKSETCLEVSRKLGKKIRVECELQRQTLSDDYDYNKDTVDKSPKGIWYGWVQRVLLGGALPNKPVFMKIDAPQGRIFFGEEEMYKIAGVNWPCKKAQPCLPKEFAEESNAPAFESKVKELGKRIGVEGVEHCFILPFEKAGVNLICVLDLNQEESIKTALMNAYSEVTKDGSAYDIPYAEEGSDWNAIFSHSSYKETKSEMRLGKSGLDKMPEKKLVVGYTDFEKYKDVKCGLEFREITLPESIKGQAIDPHCCFNINLKSKAGAFCIKDQIRCVAKARKVMRRVKYLCMKAKYEIGEVTEEELNKELSNEASYHAGIGPTKGLPFSMDSFLSSSLDGGAGANGSGAGGDGSGGSGDGSGGNGDGSGNGSGSGSGGDGANGDGSGGAGGSGGDGSSGEWKGNGSSAKIVPVPQIKKGPISIEKGIVSLSEDITFPASNIYFTCMGVDPCDPTEWAARKKNFLAPFDFDRMLVGVKEFLKGAGVSSEDNCVVVEVEQPIVHYIDSFMVCLDNVPAARGLKTALRVAYEKALDLLKPGDPEFKDLIPEISSDWKTSFTILLPNENPTDRLLGADTYKLKEMEGGKATIFQFSDVDVGGDGKCKVGGMEKVPDNFKPSNLNCCLEISAFEKKIGLCPISSVRCVKPKMMLLKHILSHCSSAENKAISGESESSPFSLKNPARVALIEMFDFGLDLKTLTKKFPENPGKLSAMTEDDSVNGKWKGWVQSLDITKRGMRDKLSLTYIKVGRDGISFFTDRGDAKPLIHYPILMVNFPCKDTPMPCNALQYIEYYKKTATYGSSHQLALAFRNYLKQLSQEDPSLCIILDLEDNVIRAKKSVILCTLSNEETKGLANSVSNAYYEAFLTADMATEVPLAAYDAEKFDTIIIEDGKHNVFPIAFTRTSIQHVKSEDEKVDLYNYKEMIGDAAGNPCAIWFRGIKVHKESGVKDPNCCLLFKRKPNSSIIICAKARFRCIKDTKMMIKKLKMACLEVPGGAKGYKGGEGGDDSAHGGLDTSAKSSRADELLHSDPHNGVWRGLGMYGEILVGQEPPKKLELISIDPSGVKIFDDETSKMPRILIELQNVIIPCTTDTVCSIKQFIESFDKEKDFEKKELKREVAIAVEILPKGMNPDDLCAMIWYLVNDKKKATLLCSNDPTQGANLKKALATAIQLMLKSIDFSKIPLPSPDYKFAIKIYRSVQQKLTSMTAQLKKAGLVNIAKGKELAYMDIEPSKYGEPCTFWYKSIKLPTELEKEQADCCIATSVNQEAVFICVDKSAKCMIESLMLMKGLHTGCMDPEGKIDLKKLKEDEGKDGVADPDKKTEIYGADDVMKEEAKDDGDKKKRFAHTTDEDFKHSKEDRIWHGWMMVTTIADPDNQPTPGIFYVDLNADGLKHHSDFATMDRDPPKELFSIAELRLVCPNLCSPSEYIKHYVENPNEKEDVAAIESTVHIGMEAVGGNEKDCLVNEYRRDGVRFTRLYCILQVDESYLIKFRDQLLSNFAFASRLLNVGSLPTPPDGDRFKVEFFEEGGMASKTHDVKIATLSLENQVDGKPLITYTDIEECNLCFTLAEELDEIKSDSECCFSGIMKKKRFFACVDEEMCEPRSKALLNRVWKSCSQLKGIASAAEPLPCDDPSNRDKKKDTAKTDSVSVKRQFRSRVFDMKKMEKEEEKKKEEKKEVQAFLSKVKSKLENLNNKKAVEVKKTPEGILQVNADGSKTLQKDDGETVITEKDGSTVTVNGEGDMILNDGEAITEVKADGEMAAKFKEESKEMTVSASGEVKQMKVEGNAMSEMTVSASGEAQMKMETNAAAVATMTASMQAARQMMATATVSGSFGMMAKANAAANMAMTITAAAHQAADMAAKATGQAAVQAKAEAAKFQAQAAAIASGDMQMVEDLIQEAQERMEMRKVTATQHASLEANMHGAKSMSKKKAREEVVEEPKAPEPPKDQPMIEDTSKVEGLSHAEPDYDGYINTLGDKELTLLLIQEMKRVNTDHQCENYF